MTIPFDPSKAFTPTTPSTQSDPPVSKPTTPETLVETVTQLKEENEKLQSEQPKEEPKILNVNKLRNILKNHGMDSQMTERAIVAIKELLNESN